jgi:hypothetical protein
MTANYIDKYPAKVFGEVREVAGWDEKRRLLLSDGTCFDFTPLQEPIFDYTCKRLLEVARFEWKPVETPNDNEDEIEGENIRKKTGKWLLNGCETPEAAWVMSPAQMTILLAIHETGQPSCDEPNAICAIAWFECGDGAGGWNTPIFLRSFRKIVQNCSARRVAAQKPVSRFEQDFKVAVIARRGGGEQAVTVETELRGLIKKIVEAGGRISRIDLRSGKEPTYQPEKLLESKVAKALIRAKLIGNAKGPGRTVVYWVKPQVA